MNKPNTTGILETTPPLTIDKFLQPESMVTPAALGSIVLGISGAVGVLFELDDPGYAAATVSFLFGIVVVLKIQHMPTKLLFWIINSLIIFSFAMGNNMVLRQVVSHKRSGNGMGSSITFISPAYAQTSPDVQDPNPFFKPWFGIGAPPPQSGSISPPLTKSQTQGWQVIVGSFQTKERADALAQKISADHPNKYDILVAPCLKGNCWAVAIGKDLSLNEAVRIKTEADKDQIAPDTFLYQIKG